MSQSENLEEATRWLITSKEDFRAAVLLLSGDSYPHSCFYSQQTGEKAVKAIGFYFGKEPWGHSIQKIIVDIHAEFVLDQFEELISAAVVLDKYYIAARYPDSLPELTPGDIFQRNDAEKALENARFLLEYTESILKG
jgi:HEPN domain-containing protein